MKNYEYCKYTYVHKKIVEFLVNKYFKDVVIKVEMERRAKNHDMDKLVNYLIYDKKVASKIHRENSSHHANSLEKNTYDYLEMIIDWESARYTKPDKPLNAFDTLYKHYPELEAYILPLLIQMGLNKPNTAPESDVLEFADKLLSETTKQDITNEINQYITQIQR